MATATAIRPTRLRAWGITLVSGLPLWLFSLAIMAEGFPRPPISIQLAIGVVVLAMAASLVLLSKKLMTVDLLLCSLMPFILLVSFDEISTTYKSPFIILCALLLTVGIAGYQHNRSAPWRWLILLVGVIATLLLASHAANRYWQMADALGYVRCFPDAFGCAPLTSQAPAWWMLVFSF